MNTIKVKPYKKFCITSLSSSCYKLISGHMLSTKYSENNIENKIKILLFVLMLAFILSSCSSPKRIDPTIFNKIGKATNLDILREMKDHPDPHKIVLHDSDKYWYRYLNNTVFAFENNILCEVSFISDDKNHIIEGKNQCSHNIWNDKLGNMWIDSKYKYVEMPLKPEIDLKTVTADEFLQKITPGTKKGVLFRLIGKPNLSYEEKGEERWKYTVDKMNYGKQSQGFLGMADVKLRYSGRSVLNEFIIVLKNDVVVDRFVSSEAEFTEEEKKETMEFSLKTLKKMINTELKNN